MSLNLRNIGEPAEELLSEISNGTIKNKEIFERRKIEISKKYKLPKIMKSADVILYLKENNKDPSEFLHILKTKPVRSLSGVSNVAIMWLGENDYSCPFSCIFCPQGKYSPKAYTGVEPTTMRARRNKYDAYLQVKNRLEQFSLIGHPTEKCELIIMGGTFMAWGKDQRENFIKRAFDGFNNSDSSSLENAKLVNETTKNRIIGLTIETRADYCSKSQIDTMLNYGTTRVEIGVQTTDNELQALINRGHDSQKNINAINDLRDAGLKITIHWMPGLTGLSGEIDIEKEVKMFESLFTSKDYQPDELKIYPTLVIPGTKLHELWKQGKYKPLDNEIMIKLLIKLKSKIPKYVRVKRIMRDISEHEASAGATKTNLRQIAMQSGVICRCIRCREIGFSSTKPKDIKLDVLEYNAGNGKEFFISFEDKNELLIGFTRLRLSQTARIREIHVYGREVPISKDDSEYQHTGYGAKLINKAEEIVKKAGYDKISVTAGVGVREYFRKLGYENDSFYMSKFLNQN